MHALVSSNLLPVDSDFDVLSQMRSLNARALGSAYVNRQGYVARAAESEPAYGFVYVTSWTNFVDRISEPRATATAAYRINAGFRSDELPLEAGLSPLGRKLLALRRADIARGMVLMDEDEIRDEVARRRGELR